MPPAGLGPRFARFSRYFLAQAQAQADSGSVTIVEQNEGGWPVAQPGTKLRLRTQPRHFGWMVPPWGHGSCHETGGDQCNRSCWKGVGAGVRPKKTCEW